LRPSFQLAFAANNESNATTSFVDVNRHSRSSLMCPKIDSNIAAIDHIVDNGNGLREWQQCTRQCRADSKCVIGCLAGAASMG